MKKLIRNSTAEFLIFTSQAGEDSIEVRVEDETVWLTQKLIAELFGKGRSTITEHLRNIFSEAELVEGSVCREFRHTGGDGKSYQTKFITSTPLSLSATASTPSAPPNFASGQRRCCVSLPSRVLCWITNVLKMAFL